MINKLSGLKKFPLRLLCLLKDKVFKYKERKRKFYLALSILDVLLIFLVLTKSYPTAQRLISPFIDRVSLGVVGHEFYAFAPGQAPNKFKYIDFEGLSILAYFDIPVLPNGELNTNSWGYKTIGEDSTEELFDQAHYFNSKVLITLTQRNQSSIQGILDDIGVQKNLVENSLEILNQTGADGLLIDFEFRNTLDLNYKFKFNNFIKDFTDFLHDQDKKYLLAVVVPSFAAQENKYDLTILSKVSDKIFISTDDIATVESKNGSIISPIYGFDGHTYWEKIAVQVNNFYKFIPREKLVVERAWYGNGNRYPLYIPNGKKVAESGHSPSSVMLDKDTVERLVAHVPEEARRAARENIPLIGEALSDEGILDSNVLAYALATVEHETDGTFEPIDEIQGKLHARRLGYEGGTNFFGRGFIQLTHLRNYKAIGERIGVGDELVKNPKLASSPKIAAKILAAFFKDNNIANLASQGNFVSARVPINPDRNGWKIANLASKYGIY